MRGPASLLGSPPGMSRSIPWPVSGAAVALAVPAGRVSVAELKKAGTGRCRGCGDPLVEESGPGLLRSRSEAF